jgi:predicted site-specific integrase-resolvase
MDARLEAKYTPARAGALAGVSGQTIGQWARYGFIKPTVYEGRPINLA